MLADHATRAEKLHLAQLPAQAGQKVKTIIHILERSRQTGPHHQDPAGNGRGNKQLVFPRLDQSFFPRTGRRMMQIQRGLHHGRIAGLDHQPAAWLLEDRGMKAHAPGHGQRVEAFRVLLPCQARPAPGAKDEKKADARNYSKWNQHQKPRDFFEFSLVHTACTNVTPVGLNVQPKTAILSEKFAVVPVRQTRFHVVP
jgi:hypothetical protein